MLKSHCFTYAQSLLCLRCKYIPVLQRKWIFVQLYKNSNSISLIGLLGNTVVAQLNSKSSKSQVVQWKKLLLLSESPNHPEGGGIDGKRCVALLKSKLSNLQVAQWTIILLCSCFLRSRCDTLRWKEFSVEFLNCNSFYLNYFSI